MKYLIFSSILMLSINASAAISRYCENLMRETEQDLLSTQITSKSVATGRHSVAELRFYREMARVQISDAEMGCELEGKDSKKTIRARAKLALKKVL